MAHPSIPTKKSPPTFELAGLLFAAFRRWTAHALKHFADFIAAKSGGGFQPPSQIKLERKTWRLETAATIRSSRLHLFENLGFLTKNLVLSVAEVLSDIHIDRMVGMCRKSMPLIDAISVKNSDSKTLLKKPNTAFS